MDKKIRMHRRFAAAVFGVGAALCLTMGTGAGIVGAQPDDSVQWNIGGIEEKYDFGAAFVVPAGSVTVGGVTAQAEASLIFPDGTATAAEEVSLTQTGLYTLRYAARADGKPYGTEFTFSVDADFFTCGENSSVRYGVYTDFGCGAYAERNSGVLVRLAQEDSIRFNTPVDVSDATADDVLASVFVTPDVQGTADFDRLVFTLTDSLDPNVTLTIAADRVIDSTWGDGSVYLKAAGNGQPLTGWESAAGILHVNDEWGAPVNSTFIARRSDMSEMPPAAYPVTIRYSAAEKQVFAGYNDAGGSAVMIADLDSPEHFISLWNGFPSGKVYVSVSASGYNSNTANFCIAEVGDMVLSEEALSSSVSDTEPPEIVVDAGYDKPPEAGIGKEYPVFAATATDGISGACEVVVSVWYDYTSDAPVIIDVTDGRFRTDKYGNYAVVYRARDRAGNEAEKVVYVHYGGEIAPISVLLPDDRQTECIVGEYLPVLPAEISGGSGDVRVTVSVCKGEEVFSADEGGVQIPEEGEWTVIYTATDFIGNVETASYTVTATASDYAVFYPAPVIPKVYIAGGEYVIPEYYATDYSSGNHRWSAG